MCKMSTCIGNPLTCGIDALTMKAEEQSSVLPPYSYSDPNKNFVPSENELLQAKRFNFLVWHHGCDKQMADKIYVEMEDRGLRGYIDERDKIVGQYKLSAMEAAIRTTENVILLLSREALECAEFKHKMHQTIATSGTFIIPVRLGIDKREVPRALHHHVAIPFEDDRFWDRLCTSIKRVKHINSDGGSGKSSGHQVSSKGRKESPPTTSSPLLGRSVKEIKVVPDTCHQTNGRSSAQPKKQSELRRLLSFLTRSKNPPKTPEETPVMIQLQPVTRDRTRQLPL